MQRTKARKQKLKMIISFTRAASEVARSGTSALRMQRWSPTTVLHLHLLVRQDPSRCFQTHCSTATLDASHAASQLQQSSARHFPPAPTATKQRRRVSSPRCPLPVAAVAAGSHPSKRVLGSLVLHVQLSPKSRFRLRLVLLLLQPQLQHWRQLLLLQLQFKYSQRRTSNASSRPTLTFARASRTGTVASVCLLRSHTTWLLRCSAELRWQGE